MNLGSGPASRLAAVGPATGATRREGSRADASPEGGPAFEVDVGARPADSGQRRDAARAHERGERIRGRDETRRAMPERDDAVRDSGTAGDAERSQTRDAATRRTSGAERGEREQRIARESGAARTRAPRDPRGVSNDGDASRRIAGTTQEAGQKPASDTGMDAPLADHMLALLSGEWQSAPATPRTAGVDAGVVASAPEGLQPSIAMTGALRMSGTAMGGIASGGTLGAAALPGSSGHLPADALPLPGLASGDGTPVPAAAGATASDAPLASLHPAAAAASAAPAALAGMSRTDGAGSAPAPLSADALAAALAIAPGRAEDAATASAIDPAPTGIGDAPLVFSLAPGAREVATPPRATEILAAVPMPADPEAGFDDAFGSRIVWMAEQRIGHAELRVSPGQLGAIDIRLELDGNRVSAQFNAGNAEVRQALEAGMDRLRDLLGRQGMELAQSSVGGERRQSGGDLAGRPADTGASSDATAPDDTPMTLRTLRARGLVDEYA